MVDNVLVPSEDTKKRCAYVTQFMEEHVYSNERVLARSTTPEAQALQKELQGINKANGYWAPHLPSEAGGMGVGFLTYAYMNEIIGRSGQAPSLFGSQAPDSGNAEILHQYGTSEQKDKYLAPLVNGDVRSCFSMTEPAVSGADPTGLETTAVREATSG